MQSRFRLAACQLGAIQECCDYPSLTETLANLPGDLNAMYGRILESLSARRKSYTIKLLKFLAYSKRPLTIEEAVDDVATDPNKIPGFEPKNRMPKPREILRFCSSLVTITDVVDSELGWISDEPSTHRDIEQHKKVGGHSILQLAHLSVREYLTSNHVHADYAQSLERTTAAADITKLCIAYLSVLKFEIPGSKIQESMFLAEYAAQYWKYFAAIA